MSENKTKDVFSNAAGQPIAYVYDAEINNYVERPIAIADTKSGQRPDVIYIPEKNDYDAPPAP